MFLIIYLWFHLLSVVNGNTVHIRWQINTMHVHSVAGQNKIRLESKIEIVNFILLSGHKESWASSPRTNVKNFHTRLQIQKLNKLFGSCLSSNADPGLAKDFLISCDSISKWKVFITRFQKNINEICMYFEYWFPSRNFWCFSVLMLAFIVAGAGILIV